MANLNIPFLLLQPSTCKFQPSIATTKLIAFDRCNSIRSPMPFQGSARMSQNMNQSIVKGINVTTEQSSKASFIHRESEIGEAKTKFEFGKYSTFDDTPKNLIITGDKESGAMVLWHQDSHFSHKSITIGGVKRVSKFIMSLIPRIALVPSISVNTGPLVSHCMVVSPAPNILSTSAYLIVTIHKDNILRLWNTDDGRCILSSQPDLIGAHPGSYTVKSLKQGGALSGVILVIGGTHKEMLFVNAYKMTIVKRVVHTLIGGNVTAKVLDFRSFALTDNSKALQIWTRQGGDSASSSSRPAQNRPRQSVDSQSSQQASLLLDITSTEDQQLLQSLNYIQKLESHIDEYDKILQFKVIKQEVYIATVNGISMWKDSVMNELARTSRCQLIFAKFMTHDKMSLALTIDSNFQLNVYDLRRECKLIHTGDMIASSQYFEPYSIKSEEISLHYSLVHDIKQERFDTLKTFKDACLKNPLFKFNKDECFLYTIQDLKGIQGKVVEPTFITWSLQTFLDNLVLQHSSSQIPLTMTPMRIFQQEAPEHRNQSILNFQPLLIKSFYNRNQFDFFYTDEKITDSAVYTSSNNPSYILGTNHGRIFMVSMFQEVDERLQPVFLVDAHNKSPITKLFVAYNSGRKGNIPQRQNTRGTRDSGTDSLQQSGGHLISVSEDGTISVLNLNSTEIFKALHNFQKCQTGPFARTQDGKRADAYFEERNDNSVKKRRNSFSNDFTISNYYHLVRVKPQKVYAYAAYGQCDKILEVKSLNTLQDQLRGYSDLKSNSSAASTASRTTASTKHMPPETKLSDESLLRHQVVAKTQNDEAPGYAVVSSEGGTVHIVRVSNLNTEIVQISGIDTTSEIIGVYQDFLTNQIYVLTKKNLKQAAAPPKEESKLKGPSSQSLFQAAQMAAMQKKGGPTYLPAQTAISLYVYNGRSYTLLRRADQKYAMEVLMTRETVDHLLNKNEGFKMAATQISNSILDYEGFQQFFTNSKGGPLMGLGSHKILDYLSLSLNLPLEYHPHSALSTKYTKTARDLLHVRKQLIQVGSGAGGNSSAQRVSEEAIMSPEECQRQVIIALNDAVFLNNSLYHSDFNEDYFNQSAGSTCIQTASNSFFGSKQHVIIANAKQILSIMQKRIQSEIKPPIFQKGRSNSPTSPLLPNQQHRHGGDNDDFVMHAEEKKIGEGPAKMIMQQPIQPGMLPQVNNKLAQSKWPTSLFTLLHPFNLEDVLDDALEKFYGLSLPFLDFRIGLQGADESFSFVLTREDEDFHSQRNNSAKIIRMLRLSHMKQDKLDQAKKEHPAHLNLAIQEVEMFVDAMLESEPQQRFFQSENWRISGYMSTIMPTFFLSILTGIVESAREEVGFIIQEWLLLIQKINQQRTITEGCRLSLSSISKVLLKKDASISATGRDVLLKPVLFVLSEADQKDRLNDVIDEWTTVILDTYRKLKKESSTNVNSQGGSDQKYIDKYFGELEIRGLICISYYALYNSEKIEDNIKKRVSRMTTMLTRGVVEKYNNDPRYIHLLTHLLQLMSTWMKTSHNQLNSKQVNNEIIILLLYIYNINKQPLKNDTVITRVTGENFYLIKPTKPELYLKLTAAKTLLEIGAHNPHDFLAAVQDEGITLNKGADYQLNVLEILKIFINSSQTQNDPLQPQQQNILEHHLIQITQILLKCFDPNELALRKNSHRTVSAILSILVKMFPMVAFHPESQRLAVGTHDGPIAIYDMRTTAKWKILEGHQGNITCLAFDSKGNSLASYSAVDKTLQLWKVGNTGFFSTIMGGTSRSSNKINLAPMPHHIKSPHQRKADNLQTLQQEEFNRNNSFFQAHPVGEAANEQAQQQIKRAEHSRRVNCCSIKFVIPKEKEVNLTRENGLTDLYKLVK